MKITELSYRDYDRRFVLVTKSGNLLKKLKIKDIKEPFYGFIYIDPEMGVSMQVLGDDKTGTKYIDEERINVGYKGLKDYNIEFIDNYEYEDLVLDINKEYYSNKARIKIRQNEKLDKFRYESHPDDLKAVVIYQEDDSTEELWIRVEDTVNNDDVIVGKLLSTSIKDNHLNVGEYVAVKFYEKENELVIIDRLVRQEVKEDEVKESTSNEEPIQENIEEKEPTEEQVKKEEEFVETKKKTLTLSDIKNRFTSEEDANKELNTLLEQSNRRLFEIFLDLCILKEIPQDSAKRLISLLKETEERNMLIKYMLNGEPVDQRDIYRQAFVIRSKPLPYNAKKLDYIDLSNEEKQLVNKYNIPNSFNDNLTLNELYSNIKWLEKEKVNMNEQELELTNNLIDEKLSPMIPTNQNKEIHIYEGNNITTLFLDKEGLANICGLKAKLYFKNDTSIVGFIGSDIKDNKLSIYEEYDESKGFYDYNSYDIDEIIRIDAIKLDIPRYKEKIDFEIELNKN